MQSGAVNHAACAPPMCSLRGAATYGKWYERDVLHPHSCTQPQHRTTEQPPGEPRGTTMRLHQHFILMDLYEATHWLRNYHFVFPQINNSWDCGCLLVFCNVGIWILHSEAEFTRIQPGTSLCVQSLFGSRMQRAAGLDRGWGKREECIWILSPCGVTVDRDGSRSEWGQRWSNTSSHYWAWGWQLFGLHRYCCCFFMILHVSLHTHISPRKCHVDLRWWNGWVI